MDIAQRIAVAAAPAAAHAGEAWRQAALERVRRYAELHDVFIIEQVRLQAEGEGFERPPTARAWGWVALAAHKAGYISRLSATYNTAPTAHPAIVTKWRSMLRH